MRRPPLLIEPHRIRSIASLSGLLDGPVAIDAARRVSFLTDDGVLGQLAPDGNLRWSFLVGPPGGESAIGPAGTYYAAGRDGVLYAVDENGWLAWTARLHGRPVRGVAVGLDRIVVALDTGQLELWRRGGSAVMRVDLGGTPCAAAVLPATDWSVVPLCSGVVVGVKRGRVAWRTRIAHAPLAPLAVANAGTVVAAAADGTVARLAADGAVEWRVQAGGPVTRSVALDDSQSVLVAAGDSVVALSPQGEVRWRRELGADIVGSPLVADDGSVYVAVQPCPSAQAAGCVRVLDSSGEGNHAIVLPAAPTPGLALDGGWLWVALTDFTLRRYAVPQQGLARSSWPKSRGNSQNTGAR